MTIDKSLKVKKGGVANKSVMTRVERINRLKEIGKWEDGNAILGMPKVRVVKISMKKKKKEKTEEKDEKKKKK
ncbi:MAG TPA: small basic protein [Pirellulaceae bacterium]|jgi:small basic protein (TIGR04137 family)|nr:small basic protein [Pirellulaceae bacterium]